MTDYDSGPFCRHFGDPSDCDEVCANCGHKCYAHRDGCDECNCEEWEDTDDE